MRSGKAPTPVVALDSREKPQKKKSRSSRMANGGIFDVISVTIIILMRVRRAHR